MRWRNGLQRACHPLTVLPIPCHLSHPTPWVQQPCVPVRYRASYGHAIACGTVSGQTIAPHEDTFTSRGANILGPPSLDPACPLCGSVDGYSDAAQVLYRL